MNKATILYIALILLASITSYGQDSKKDKKMKIGIRGGYQSATFVYEGSKPDTASRLNTFYIGLFRDTRIIPLLHFGSGLEYFQNGMKYSGNTKRVLHTVSVPLDLKLKLGPVFVLGGAALNLKVSEKIIRGDDKYDPASGDKSEWFDVAAFAGAGVKIFFLTV